MTYQSEFYSKLNINNSIYESEITTKWDPDKDDELWLEELNNFDSEISTIESVYRHLLLFEDYSHGYESKFDDQLGEWLHRILNSKDNNWQKIFISAWTEEQKINKKFEDYKYWRPSLWFLHESWMKFHKQPQIATYDTRLFFGELPGQIEEMLIWDSKSYKSL